MDKHKLILPISILLGCIILGGFFFASQVNKQRSIERQQVLKLAEDRRLEEAKAEQTKREYIAKRKNDCYDIYEKERDKFKNISSYEYDKEEDVCVVIYKAVSGKWKDQNCEDILSTIDPIKFPNIYEQLKESYSNCISNAFKKRF